MSATNPAPWQLHKTDDTCIIDANGTEIADMCGDYGDEADWPRMEANARLMSAAPDMLDALKRLIEPAPGVAKLPPWVYGIVVPAIAKAEGRS